MDYHKEMLTFNAYRMDFTYSETCVNVNDGNAPMGQLLKNRQHSLISREVSGIAVASYSLLNSNLCAIKVYTVEEHCSMILRIVDTATTMFPVTSAVIDGVASYA